MKFTLLLSVCCLVVSFATLHISCTGNTNSKVQRSDLFYYPEKNIYYDSIRSTYYYSLDSAKTWDSMVYRSADYGSVLGAKIAIKRNEDNIAWSKNDSDRKAYNGTVLNIVNSHTIFLGKTDSINKLKPKVIVKYKPAEVKEEGQEEVKEEPAKKGLNKFFNKLFGKKKKKAS